MRVTDIIVSEAWVSSSLATGSLVSRFGVGGIVDTLSTVSAPF